MSRVGKLPIAIPDGVSVSLTESEITVKGSKGELKTSFTKDVSITQEDGQIVVKPANNGHRARSMWGTMRSVIASLIEGASQGFVRRLEIVGVGYRAALQGDMLNLSLGYSHDVRFALPEGVSVKCEKPTSIEISGANKQLVGQVASDIRALRPPEPYKGKGVRFEGEFIMMKEGKKK